MKKTVVPIVDNVDNYVDKKQKSGHLGVYSRKKEHLTYIWGEKCLQDCG